jgi:hypothetical protein
MVRRFVWSRNLVNKEALDPWGAVAPETNKQFRDDQSSLWFSSIQYRAGKTYIFKFRWQKILIIVLGRKEAELDIFIYIQNIG